MRISFPVVSFKKEDMSCEKSKDTGESSFNVVMPVSAIPQVIWDWHQGVNPREICVTKAPYRSMVKTLTEQPETFFKRNRGLTLLAESAEFDNRNNIMVLTMKDPALHGLCDGAHSVHAIHAVMKKKAEKGERLEAFIRANVMTGCTDKDEILEIVESRNTSTQVQNVSLLNQKGEFQMIKDALAGEPYENWIAYKQNQTDENGDGLPVKVEEVIAALICFDTAFFDSETHPTMAYNGRQTVLNHYVKHGENMKKVLKIAPSILALRDVIFEGIPLSLPRGKSITSLDSCYEYETFLPFTGVNSDYEISGAYVYPFLAALRQLTKKNAQGDLVWGPQDPFEFTKKHLGGYVKETMRMMNEDELFPNANKMGKNRAVYKFAYMYVAERLR